MTEPERIDAGKLFREPVVSTLPYTLSIRSDFLVDSRFTSFKLDRERLVASTVSDIRLWTRTVLTPILALLDIGWRSGSSEGIRLLDRQSHMWPFGRAVLDIIGTWPR